MSDDLELLLVGDDIPNHDWVVEPGSSPPRQWCSRCHRGRYITRTAERLGVSIHGACMPHNHTGDA